MRQAVPYILTLILMIPCFNLEAQEKSDISSSLMLLYSPFDKSGKVASETTALGGNHVGYGRCHVSGWVEWVIVTYKSNPNKFSKLFWK